MKIAKLSEIKDELSRYVGEVRRGQRVRILVRGVPAADLVPVTDAPTVGGANDPHLPSLERAGLLRRGAGPIGDDLLRPGPLVRGKSVAETLIEERRKR